jgi:hypothetical protein
MCNKSKLKGVGMKNTRLTAVVISRDVRISEESLRHKLAIGISEKLFKYAPRTEHKYLEETCKALLKIEEILDMQHDRDRWFKIYHRMVDDILLESIFRDMIKETIIDLKNNIDVFIEWDLNYSKTTELFKSWLTDLLLKNKDKIYRLMESLKS